VLVCRVFPSQTFAINMQIKTAIFIAIATGCASAENATYIGCYHDCNGGRDLPAFYCSNGKTDDVNCGPSSSCANDPSGMQNYAGHDAMTTVVCSALCKGFKFFGMEAGGQCFCGNDYGNQGGKVPESDCNVPCPGDASIMCGSSNRNSIYAQPPNMYQNATTSSH
jgi:hypothetical protein